MFIVITKHATGRQVNLVWEGPKIWVIILKECSLLEMVVKEYSFFYIVLLQKSNHIGKGKSKSNAYKV